MTDVGALLAQARTAHEAYRMALPRFDPRTKQVMPGNSAEAARCLQRAYDLRLQAEHLDVLGLSSAWADDAVNAPHYALLKFYDSEEPEVKKRIVAPARDRDDDTISPTKVKPRG